MDIAVATLPDTRRNAVSARTDAPGVSTLTRCDSNLDLRLLYQRDSTPKCLSRSILVIHIVAETLSNLNMLVYQTHLVQGPAKQVNCFQK